MLRLGAGVSPTPERRAHGSRYGAVNGSPFALQE